jgi:tetratricopeptide (TPR) repeat protein
LSRSACKRARKRWAEAMNRGTSQAETGSVRRVTLVALAVLMSLAVADRAAAVQAAEAKEAPDGVVAASVTGPDGGQALPTGKAGQNLEMAETYFRKAELADPSASWRDGYYRKAEALAESVLKADPNCAEAHFLLFATRGRRILANGPSVSDLWQLPALNAHLQRALELDPRHAHALAAKGGMLLDLPSFAGGDVKAAREYLERAVALNPGGVGTRVTFARVLMKQGEPVPARKQLLTAAHYACVLRQKDALVEVEQLLAKLDSKPL